MGERTTARAGAAERPAAGQKRLVRQKRLDGSHARTSLEFRMGTGNTAGVKSSACNACWVQSLVVGVS